MKISNIFKHSLKIVTIFIPQARLAKLAIGVGLWAIESLVKNSKTTLDDDAYKVAKKLLSDKIIIKNNANSKKSPK